MALICIVLMVLLYTNKIHFESKKFDDIIVAHTAKMQAKLAQNQPNTLVVEEQPSVEENKEETNNNDEPLVQETTVSTDSATNEDKIADDKEIKE